MLISKQAYQKVEADTKALEKHLNAPHYGQKRIIILLHFNIYNQLDKITIICYIIQPSYIIQQKSLNSSYELYYIIWKNQKRY